jgi:hypothetical protein
MSYINPYTVRIMGEVVPAHQGRGGCPIASDLDEAKKDKTRKRSGRDWGREGSRTGLSQEAARERLVNIEKELEELKSVQEEKRQRWLKADQNRYELSVHERELSKAGREQCASEKKVKAPRTVQQQQAYQDLFQARRTAEILFLDWLKDDSRLRDLRATRYALQKIAKTRPNTSLPNSTPPPTQPTWTNPCTENKTESIRTIIYYKESPTQSPVRAPLAILRLPRMILGCALSTRMPPQPYPMSLKLSGNILLLPAIALNFSPVIIEL